MPRLRLSLENGQRESKGLFEEIGVAMKIVRGDLESR